MKRISKLALLTLAGALALTALTGCSYEKTRDAVVNGYMSIQDGVVNGWDSMVDGFVADAPKYGVSAPASGSDSMQ